MPAGVESAIPANLDRHPGKGRHPHFLAVKIKPCMVDLLQLPMTLRPYQSVRPCAD
jgi:hypothetical protein